MSAGVEALIAKGFDEPLAREVLTETRGNVTAALER